MINRPSSSKPMSRPSSSHAMAHRNRLEHNDNSASSIASSTLVNNTLNTIINSNNLLPPTSAGNGVGSTLPTVSNSNNNNPFNVANERNLNSSYNLSLNRDREPSYTTQSIIPPVQSSINSSSSFYVIINGAISHAEFPGAGNIACSFQFVYGQDWEIVRSTGEGVSLESGVTQVSMRKNGFDAKYVWNFPLEISFRSTNPQGWPKLCLVVQEGTGKQKILGYGWCQVPMGAGKQTKTIRLFKPQSTSLIQQIIGSIKGIAPEYYDSTLVCKGEGREVTRTECVGAEVTVEFNIMHKGMSQFGFEPMGQL